jgi:hypothetical protein
MKKSFIIAATMFFIAICSIILPISTYAAVSQNNYEQTSSFGGTLSVESKTVFLSDQVFTLDFTLSNPEMIKSIALSDFSFDSSVFEIVSGEWIVPNTVISSWDQSLRIGAVSFPDNCYVNGIIFQLTLKLKNNAVAADHSLSCNIIAKKKLSSGEEEIVDINVVSGTVTVVDVLKGDVNGDGTVTSDDAIHLLYHTFLPDQFPVNQNCDFDGNGAVASDDAIYLLYHTFLPDSFPLNTAANQPADPISVDWSFANTDEFVHIADIIGSDKSVVGSSSNNTSVASISVLNGDYIIYSMSQGTARVTVNLQDGSVYHINVTVQSNDPSPTTVKVSVVVAANGDLVQGETYSAYLTFSPALSFAQQSTLTYSLLANNNNVTVSRASANDNSKNNFIITPSVTAGDTTLTGLITSSDPSLKFEYVPKTVSINTPSTSPGLTATSTNVRGGNSVTVTLSNAPAFTYNWYITSESGETIATFENGKTECETIVTNTSRSLTIKTNVVTENQKITVHVAGYNNIEIASLQITVSK